MRKPIILALIAATVLPSAAMAQSRDEIRRDRQDVREERRELDRAIRRGESPRAVREERRDVREAQRDLRDSRRDWRNDRDRNWGRNDWRGWRDNNRHVYARGNWRAPWRYQGFRPGTHIGAPYYTQRYWISDPWRYRLPVARGHQRWVRHYDDVLLVDTRRGIVIDVIRNFYW